MSDAKVGHLLRRLRLRHVELLEALGRLPTMHAAATALSLSQPAVSKMLREIEDAFEGRLFERSRAGVRPNALGTIAIRWAQVMRNEVEGAAQEIAAARAGSGALLRVGSVSVTSIVPAAIVRLRAARPDAVVHLREGPVDLLVQRLLAGELDCVVGALAPGLLGADELKNLSVQTIARDRLCVVASVRHRLAKARRLVWDDLRDAAWVLPPMPTLVRQFFVATYVQRGLQAPQAAVEALSPVTLSTLVRADAGLLGLMRSEQVRGETGNSALRELPVGPPAPLPSMSLFTRRMKSGPPVILAAFVQALKADRAGA